MKTKLLQSQDIIEIIRSVGIDEIMDTVIENLNTAFNNYSKEKIDVPVRSGFNYTKPNVGLIEWMPLYQIGDKVTIKIVGYHPDNPKANNLPTILSSISQYDTKTGHLTGIVDGVLLTAMRTGAASALATSLLSAPHSSKLGLIGVGAQAVTQLHGISRVRNIKQVYFFDIDELTTKSFIERTKVLALDCELIPSSIEEIVENCDIVCTATSINVGEGPLFENLTYQDHTHFNAVGSDFPGKVELPMDIINRAFLCADFTAQALVEGEFQRVTQDEINCDLSELVKSSEKYELTKNQTTVFDSTGHALEDHVIMGLFLELAEKYNLGSDIELEYVPSDSKDPYFSLNSITALEHS